jgi:hypothetical protein
MAIGRCRPRRQAPQPDDPLRDENGDEDGDEQSDEQQQEAGRVGPTDGDLLARSLPRTMFSAMDR